MLFETEDQAKEYAINQTSGKLNKQEIDIRISDYEMYAHQAASDKDRKYWEFEKERLEQWKASHEFINGEYPDGVDELMFNLLDSRSSIYSFINVETKSSPFSDFYFFKQWVVGSSYWIFATIGKLVSNDDRDNSLRSLWMKVLPYLKLSNVSNILEIDYLTKCLDKKNGHFTNLNSKAINFRNKQIAHNESKPIILWSEIDVDLKILSRMWSIITMWCSFGILMPFRNPSEVFMGLDKIYSIDEISMLKQKYSESVTEIQSWCERCVLTGEKISNRSPFSQISVSIEIVK